MTVQLDLPEDLHRTAAAWAERGGVPLEGFLTQAVTVALVGLELRGDGGLEELRERAARADLAAARAALAAVVDMPEGESDDLRDHVPVP